MMNNKKRALLCLGLVSSGLYVQEQRAMSWIKPVALVGTCVSLGGAAKTLWTRYVTLGRIERQLFPTLAMHSDDAPRPIYNWMMSDWPTCAAIRATKNAHEGTYLLKEQLRIDAVARNVDVYEYGTEIKVPTGKTVTWNDILYSIGREQKILAGWMKELESFVDVSIQGIALFGLRKDYRQAAFDLKIEYSSSRLSDEQERSLDQRMMRERAPWERALACLLLASPNYDKAYKLYWIIEQRIRRLDEILSVLAWSHIDIEKKSERR